MMVVQDGLGALRKEECTLLYELGRKPRIESRGREPERGYPYDLHRFKSACSRVTECCRAILGQKTERQGPKVICRRTRLALENFGALELLPRPSSHPINRTKCHPSALNPSSRSTS